MPYISKSERDVLDPLIMKLGEKIVSDGQLNYVITRLCLRGLSFEYVNYGIYASTIGILETVKMEIYRRCVRPYENRKRRDHSDVKEFNRLQPRNVPK